MAHDTIVAATRPFKMRPLFNFFSCFPFVDGDTRVRAGTYLAQKDERKILKDEEWPQQF